MLRPIFPVLLTLLAGLAPLSAQESGRDLVKLTLLADHAKVAPGGQFRVGAVFSIKPGWHIYWLHPGDAGMPTKLAWAAPEGVSIKPAPWPVPSEFMIPGDILSYGYSNKVMLVTEFTLPADFKGESVRLEVQANWLACQEECVPGGASAQIEIPISATAEATHSEAFSDWERSIPRSDAPPFKAHQWNLAGENLVLSLDGIEAVEGRTIDFYPIPPEDLVLGHTKTQSAGPGPVRFEIPVLLNEQKREKTPGLLILTESAGAKVKHAWMLE